MFQNQNLKYGAFTADELKLYEYLTQQEIDIIIEHQKTLPIYQIDGYNGVYAKSLYNLLDIQTNFDIWIEEILKNKCFTKDQDYKIKILNNYQDYIFNLDMTKSLLVIANNDFGALAKKYLILIEKAFRQREEWNNERSGSIQLCKKLRSTLEKNEDKLKPFLPDKDYKWNIYNFEFNLLNKIAINTSATKYRENNKLSMNEPIRNTLGGDSLSIISKLQDYDEKLIENQKMFDWSKRKKFLIEEYNRMVKK